MKDNAFKAVMAVVAGGILAAVALAAAYGGPKRPKATDGWMAYMTNQTAFVSGDELTNLVNTLAASGQFCAVRGHAWSDYKLPTIRAGTLELWLDENGDISQPQPQYSVMRKCAVCGVKQTKVTTEEWR